MTDLESIWRHCPQVTKNLLNQLLEIRNRLDQRVRRPEEAEPSLFDAITKAEGPAAPPVTPCVQFATEMAVELVRQGKAPIEAAKGGIDAACMIFGPPPEFDGDRLMKEWLG